MGKEEMPLYFWDDPLRGGCRRLSASISPNRRQLSKAISLDLLSRNLSAWKLVRDPECLDMVFDGHQSGDRYGEDLKKQHASCALGKASACHSFCSSDVRS